MVKRILENGRSYLDHIELQSKLKAVKLDCLKASEEVKVYFEKSNHRGKPEINTIWKLWQKEARKCFLFTFKVKVGLFCSVCSKSAYNHSESIFWRTNAIDSIYISEDHCRSFLNDCAEFIRQEMIVYEFISAVAALSKCDSKGWTSFEQKYLYNPLNKTKEDLLSRYIEKKNIFQGEQEHLCDLDYTLSTMIASEMRVQAGETEPPWKTLIKDAKSIMNRYNIQQKDTIELIYQAEDDTSNNQDLIRYRIRVGATNETFTQYFKDSGFDYIDQSHIDELTMYAHRISGYMMIGLTAIAYALA